MQMVALVVLIVQHEKEATALRLYHIGEGLLVIAGILTIWSGVYYLRAAWPMLRGDVPVAQGASKPDHGRGPSCEIGRCGVDDPHSRIRMRGSNAGIAQLVEHDLAKVGVASSSLVSRSSFQAKPRLVRGFAVWVVPCR
jgi:hypothetical protein